ncbi:MAG: hypothetical protein AAF433_10215 [Bacteroidota bacterium]
MIQFKVLELGFEGTVKRFMLMMIGTILIGLAGQFFLAIVWTMVLSVSCILSIKVTVGTPKQKAADGKLVRMSHPTKSKKVS